jgi:hypothetical protein
MHFRTQFDSYCLVCLFVMIISAFGCNKDSDPMQSLSKAVAMKQSTSKLDILPVPVDRSLNADDYIQLGLPAYDRLWSGDDMVQAMRVLTIITQKDSGQLPRYKSNKSGEVFDRIVSEQNLGFYVNSNLPIQIRLNEILNYGDALNKINKLYLASFINKTTGSSETIEFQGALLRLTAVTFKLGDEFIPTLDKNDPSYSIRIEGLKNMRTGYAGTVMGSLMTIEDRESCSSKDRVRFIGYCQDTFPYIVPQLLEGSQKETVIKLQNLIKDPKMHDLKPNLQGLLEKVQNALEKVSREKP